MKAWIPLPGLDIWGCSDYGGERVASALFLSQVWQKSKIQS